MSINLSTPKVPTELKPRIMVVGVGGAGGNAVNNMIRSNLEGVECVVANTDAQALAQSLAERKVQLGLSITQGLGAGSRPEIGRAAAEEGAQEIVDHLQGCHMAFVTAGMGGGTGTGAAPVIAKLAREQGVLTVGVVTKPFQFEGGHRMKTADSGIEELESEVDTLIVIPNQNLFRIADESTTFSDAFKMADEVLYAGVRGVTDLMTMPGLINLDFADIRTVMGEMGKAMMGAGEAEGDGRAVKASESAIANPLLDDVSLRGAQGVLINITGGNDMTLYEVDEAANRIREEVDPDANIIFGSTFDEALQGRIRVSIFATGIASSATSMQPQPLHLRVREELHRRPGRTASITKPAAEPLDRVAAKTEQEAPEAPEPPAPPATEEKAEDAAAATLPTPVLINGTKAEPETAEPAAAEPEAEAVERKEPLFGRRTEAKTPPVEETPTPAPEPETDTAPVVRDFPAKEAAPKERTKARGKGRSRLLGLLIDNSAAEKEGTEVADAADETPTVELPSRDSTTSEGDAVKPANEAKPAGDEADPGADDREAAELLEIPAFLRRQAN